MCAEHARASEEGEAAATPSTMTSAVDGLRRLLEGRPTLAAARGIPAAALDSIYGVGTELYANGHHREAQQSFEMLCLYDHLAARNWHALGLCRMALKDYEGAAAALAFAVGQRDGLDSALQLALVECLLAAGVGAAAADALAPLQAHDALDSAAADKVRFFAARLGQPRPAGQEDS